MVLLAVARWYRFSSAVVLTGIMMVSMAIEGT